MGHINAITESKQEKTLHISEETVSPRDRTMRCVLPTATQQCRNYLYDKSRTNLMPNQQRQSTEGRVIIQVYCFSSVTCWHDGVGTSGSEATSDVGEILNVAVCKDGDLDIVTVNSQRNSTITQHSASDYQLIQRICLCRSVIYTHWMTWVVVLRPTRHKIDRHFRDVSPSQCLGLVWKKN